MRALFGLAVALLWGAVCFAQERITNYDVDIQVEPSGDIVITETINLISTGEEIKRGIFRELPSRRTFMGVSRPYDYTLLGIQRDGADDTVTTMRGGNAITWRIGRGDVLLDPGAHEYVIRYRVAGAVHRHDNKDELYWNATGNYWNFPIDSARATVRFPENARIIDTDSYSGRFGSQQSNTDIRIDGNAAIFRTTAPLPRKAGLTVSASIAPGVIAPLSDARKRELFWIRFGALFMLGGGGLALLFYYWKQWSRVGRDPQKPPVFARYEPPKDKSGEPYSPAAVHYIHRRGFKGMDALSSMLMQLGAQDVLDITADKKVTTIRQLQRPGGSRDAANLLDTLMAGRGDTLVLDGKTDTKFYKAITKFHQTIAKKYGPKYYQSNLILIMLMNLKLGYLNLPIKINLSF